MEKTKHFFIIFTSFFIMTFSTNAQDLYFGIGAGGTKLYNDFYTKPIINGGLGFKQEEHITVKIKLDPQVLPFRTTGHISYLMLNSARTLFNPVSSLWTENNVEISSNILSFGLGLEYEIKTPLMAPYLFFQMNVNMFGKTSLKESNTVSGVRPSNDTLPKSISDETRYGIALGMGHEFYATQNIGLDVFVKYDLTNLLGKKDFPTTVGFGQILKENNLNSFSITAIILFKI